jgi:hypothetical protein
MTKQQLIDNVLEQIQIDIIREDLTAIEEMLARLPEDILASYLSDVGFEEQHINLNK